MKKKKDHQNGRCGECREYGFDKKRRANPARRGTLGRPDHDTPWEITYLSSDL